VSLVALGVLVVAAGALAALSSWGVDVPWSVVLAVAAVTVGVALVGGAFLHLRVGGLVVIGLVLGIAAILASTIDVKLNDGIGDREYAPTTVAGLKDEYRLGIGELRLDLGKLALPAGKTHVDAGLGIGELHVIVPPKASVRVESHVGWGDSEVLGEDDNGHDVDTTVIRPAGGGAPNLVIDAPWAGHRCPAGGCLTAFRHDRQVVHPFRTQHRRPDHAASAAASRRRSASTRPRPAVFATRSSAARGSRCTALWFFMRGH
jgi:hypothetical protein